MQAAKQTLKLLSQLKFCKTILILILLCHTYISKAQECNLFIEGRVLDETTQQALGFVNVIIQELNVGAVSDENGIFRIEDICPSHYHIFISHIGCSTKKLHLDIEENTFLEIYLDHTPISLDDIVIEGNAINKSAPNEAISKDEINDNLDKNLSALLENEAGVRSLKSGSTIGKPIIQGLYGNRLVIINNGVIQSGQQWGNDHSPEIDANVAKEIKVLKGAASLEYGSNNMGSLILIDPKSVDPVRHINGRAAYQFSTNGRGHNVNLQLQKANEGISWRGVGTFKRFGDAHTPDYYLTNTGFSELDGALLLEHNWAEKWFADVYMSSFNTELGILRGSHVENVNDLQTAFERDIPFYTNDTFSYQINAPRQRVHHHLVKATLSYFISDNEWVEIIPSFQQNRRKEFDIRRGGRSEQPSLSLDLNTSAIDIKYTKELDSGRKISTGSLTSITNSRNVPETDILPLIPDYASLTSGLFGSIAKDWGAFYADIGIRYDYVFQNVATFSNGFPKEIIRYRNHFHNIGIASLSSYSFEEDQSISLNIGFATRNPAINELYSNGLHQGVSGIEEGDPNLQVEQTIKSVLEYSYNPSPRFLLSSTLFYQYFFNYIYLSPTGEVRPTIRGAFPVFAYHQNNASIRGLDLSIQYSVTNAFIIESQVNILEGRDLDNDIPLIYMPSNRLGTKITYRYPRPFNFTKLNIDNFEISWDHTYIARQNQLLDSQDFAPTPEAYYLMGVKLSANFVFSSYSLRSFIQMENVLNERYREYLNRQRYFADELGRNFQIGLAISF